MKMKKTLALVLSLVLALGMTTPAFAYNSVGSDANDYSAETVIGKDERQEKVSEYYTDINAAGEATTTVYATKGSTFTVMVPKTLILNGTESYIGNYSISVKGDVADEDSVTVAPKATEITLNKVSGASKTTNATVTQANSLFNGEDIRVDSWNSVLTGSVEAPNLTAGSWEGTMAFVITFTEGATAETPSV